MFCYTRTLYDGRFTVVVTGDRDGRYPIASALPATDRNACHVNASALRYRLLDQRDHDNAALRATRTTL